MGFWKSLGKAVVHTIEEDAKRSRKANEKEAAARRLLDEAADLRRGAIFTSSSRFEIAHLERQLLESESRSRQLQTRRLAAEDRLDFFMVRSTRDAEYREMELQNDIRRKMRRILGY